MVLKDNKTLLIALAAGLICLLAYLPAINSDFINYDDSVYVTNNPAIRILDLQFLKWAFFTSYSGWWMPLVWISFAIDYHFWGLNPFGYHLTNILLHAVNVGLVVLIADRVFKVAAYRLKADSPISPLKLEGPASSSLPGREWWHSAILLLAGLLWGLHPVNVESVAWVAERKNVLNGIFSLSCVLFYLVYLEKKDIPGERTVAARSYMFSAVLMLPALMTKPVSVVIPLIFLVFDWCLLGRFQRERILPVFLEKIPYLLFSALIALTTVLLAAGNSLLVPLSVYPLASRFISTGKAIFDACLLMVYPVDIIIMYLIPNPLPPSYTVKMAAVICFTLASLYAVRRRPWLTATWLCFLIPLLPALHFFINGAHGICAHLVYQSSIAPCIAVAALVGQSYQKAAALTSRLPRLLIVTAAAALPVWYAFLTVTHLKDWKNSETVWTKVINVRPVGRAYYYRARYFVEKGRYPEAIADLQISIKMALSAGYPDVDEIYALRADSLLKTGHYEEALDDFTAAINVKPHTNYFYHRGLVYKAMGKSREAQSDFYIAGEDAGPIYEK